MEKQTLINAAVAAIADAGVAAKIGDARAALAHLKRARALLRAAAAI